MRTRFVTAAAAALIVVTALAGCSASGGGSSSGTSGGGGGVADTSGKAAAGVTGRSASSGGAAEPAAAPAERAVVTTGSLRLVSDHPIRIAQRITDLVEAADGRIARSSEDPSGRPSAQLSLRIPSDAFQRTLTAIQQQDGVDVRDVQIDATDVTARVTDYGVRIANLRTSITRLQALLAKATSSSALVEIEGALTDRQGTLEQLLAEQRTLTDQVAYATLDVSVVVPAAAPKAGPGDFVGGLVAGFEALAATGSALAVGAGVLLPWVVVLGALGAAAALIARRVRRRPTSA
ncbi:DUF4349 domain-containing protein [uncultured Amnibacterium sp.]|uniref:DUF4349 domain-containing protein n=1 Tax=uncultured Amnibacterium sp. TaxID=1631851 RepID=UPI0035CBBDFC